MLAKIGRNSFNGCEPKTIEDKYTDYTTKLSDNLHWLLSESPNLYTIYFSYKLKLQSVCVCVCHLIPSTTVASW